MVLDNAYDGLLEFYERGESARVGFEDGCEGEECWICLECIEIAGELCDGLGGLTMMTLACGLARGGWEDLATLRLQSCRILEGVKNLRRSLWLWVGKCESGKHASEGKS